MSAVAYNKELEMVTKDQLLRAIATFIDNDMMPKATGNYKVILNLIKVAINHRADNVFKAVKENSFVSMLNVIDSHDNVDIDALATILSDALGTNEFVINFKVLTGNYEMYFSAADIQKIKSYVY